MFSKSRILNINVLPLIRRLNINVLETFIFLFSKSRILNPNKHEF